MSNVANIILAQLGGNKFLAMTDAKNLVSDTDSLMFSIPKNKSKANKIKITLTADDLYKVELFHFSNPKMNKQGEIVGGLKTIKEVSGIFAPELRQIFTNNTGMMTSLNG